MPESDAEVTAPFPGLRSFTRDEAEIFFGREQHVDRLLGILRRERFLAVIGESGSGKSSLVRAGLLPALSAGWLATGSDWRIAEMRPGHRPLRALARALLAPAALGAELGAEDASAGDGTSAAHLEAELRRGPRGLVDLVREARQAASGPAPFNVLVLVDQFEELFRYRERGVAQADEAEAFVELLLTARAADGEGIYVSITMRSDFLGHCAAFLQLPEAINHAQYLTPRLTRAELEAAISKPARLFGGSIEPELVNELINGAANDQDQLPIIQHALARMWDVARARDPDAPAIRRSDVGEGGVTGLLSRHADAVLDGIAEGSPSGARLVEVLFRTITERGSPERGGHDTRRPAKVTEIAGVAGQSWRDVVPVVRAFARDGVNLVVHTQPLDEDSRVDISHEALIRRWHRLQAWVADEAERAAEYRRWRDRATEWKRGGELLTGADLARAIEWRAGRDGWEPSVAWAARYARTEVGQEFALTLDYIARSEAHQRAIEAERRAGVERELARERQRVRQARRLTLVAGVLAVGALGFAVTSLVLFQRARKAEVAAHRATAAATSEQQRATEEARKATASARDARAQNLAARVMLQQGRDPDRALAMAIEAYRTSKTSETESVLLRMLARYEPLVGVLRRPAEPGARARVLHAAVSPDGSRVVTTHGDETAGLWDGSGRFLRLLPARMAGPALAAFSPDGGRLATADADGVGRLWDSRDGRFTALASRPGLERQPRHLALSPDGRFVLVIGPQGTATLWDTRANRTAPVAEGGVNDAAFSPDGALFATACRDAKVRLWRPGGAMLRALDGHTGSVTRVQFSPEGSFLVTGGADRTTRLWDTRDAAARPTVLTDEGEVRAVAVSRDGRFVVSVGRFATLWARDTRWAKPRQLGPRGGGRQTALAVFSPDGATVLVSGDDGAARAYDVASGERGQVFRTHEGPIVHAAFGAGGALLVTTGRDGTARLWRAQPPRPRTVPGQDAVPRFTPDGSRWLGVEGRSAVLRDPDGRELTRYAGHRGPVNHAVLSADGRRLVTASQDGAVRLWDVDGRLLATLDGHQEGAVHAAFAGGRIISLDARGTIRAWDLEGRPAGEPVKLANPPANPRTGVHVSPDGTHLVTLDAGGAARLWSTTGGLRTALVEPRGRIGGVAFSPDGRALVTLGQDGAASALWDASGRRRAELSGSGDLAQAAFSADGTRLATTGRDGTVRLWDMDGRPMYKAARFDNDNVHALFNPVSPMLVTLARDGRIRLWDVGGGRELVTLSADAALESVAVSPDGRWLVGRGPGVLHLWDCWLCARAESLIPSVEQRTGPLSAEDDTTPLDDASEG
jgi:WD40 repeat protein